MATQSKDTKKEKTIGDKIVDIIHSVTGSGTGGEDSNDPASNLIKRASEESLIGGRRRKRNIDEEIQKAGG